MHPLSLKIIPPFQVLLLGGIMWLCHRFIAPFHVHFGWEQAVSRGLLLLCLALFVATVYQFWRHKTTINPTRIHETTSLITSGVFAWSRNPVYLVDALLLLAWAIWMGQWLNLMMPLVFVWYCTRFQILAEERMLVEKFPEEFARYQERVRRWI